MTLPHDMDCLCGGCPEPHFMQTTNQRQAQLASCAPLGIMLCMALGALVWALAAVGGLYLVGRLW